MRRGEKRRGRLFLLEVLDRDDEGAPRVGFTVTKKVGNAVVRNRVRRRLREAVRVHAAGEMAPGHDYVIVGREEVLAAPFDRLGAELTRRIRARRLGSMENNRNFFITIALSVLILTLWQVFYMNPRIEAQRETARIEAERVAAEKQGRRPPQPGAPAPTRPRRRSARAGRSRHGWRPGGDPRAGARRDAARQDRHAVALPARSI